MDSRHDFTLEKVFWGYFGALDQKANSALTPAGRRPALKFRGLIPRRYITNYMALKARQYGLKHSAVLGYAPGRRSSSSSNNQSPIKQARRKQAESDSRGQGSAKQKEKGAWE